MPKLPKGYAEVSVRKVKVGTVLICDGGFTCIKAGARRMVFLDRDPKRTMDVPGTDGWVQKIAPMNHRSRLYIHCGGSHPGTRGSRHGHHYLDGQLSDDGKRYVGFWLGKPYR